MRRLEQAAVVTCYCALASNLIARHSASSSVKEQSMKLPLSRHLATAAIVATLAAAPLLAVRVGQQAPDFTGTASNGQSYKLSDLRGKFVVLEWHNNGCPYTMKHYQSGNMQRLQKEWTAKGVAWFTVISSAPGQQGYVTATQENDYLKRMNAAPTAALLDPTGQIGHLPQQTDTGVRDHAVPVRADLDPRNHRDSLHSESAFPCRTGYLRQVPLSVTRQALSPYTRACRPASHIPPCTIQANA